MFVYGEFDEPFRKPREHLVRLIGNTPLVKLGKLNPNPDVEVWVKLEKFNPGGSVKDRPALRMIADAIKRRELTKDKIIIDATSGNTGIALAMIGRVLGFKVELAMSEGVSEERKRILEIFGAKLHLTPTEEGTDGAIRFVRELVKKYPQRYYYVDQYNNHSNWKAHFYSTGVEIWKQTEGRITHFVAGAGTGGTLVGTGRRLKIFNPNIQIVGVQPAEAKHGIEGLKHMESSIKPGIFDETVIDLMVYVKTAEAYEMTRKLAKEEGLFLGISSGAAVYAAVELAKKLERGGVIVAIAPDGGEKYLSLNIWK
ncbi:MAG TPA: cysteine synthase B [Aquifex aeolicus]|uniref:Cysteine synthase n=1 Tax=Aquifex aeolicus TaxID=63363 RepID=A0A9D0YPR0_AQUAO|nr:cysteine synthase B [Aquificales bacterium]HIP98431.1 cysteine synthase B [Aquifex aeolicus]HIQ26466.1 cysteine synthase B [Aquifex aeolicus]